MTERLKCISWSELISKWKGDNMLILLFVHLLNLLRYSINCSRKLRRVTLRIAQNVLVSLVSPMHSYLILLVLEVVHYSVCCNLILSNCGELLDTVRK